jgi:hypothetical protein
MTWGEEDPTSRVPSDGDENSSGDSEDEGAGQPFIEGTPGEEEPLEEEEPSADGGTEGEPVIDEGAGEEETGAVEDPVDDETSSEEAEEPVSTPNGAAFLSQSVPVVVTAGTGFDVEVVFVNVGVNPWSMANKHFLGSENPQDNFTWSTNRLVMEEGVEIPLGQSYAFKGVLIAPEAPGTYDFQWRMLQDAVEWFGELSANLQIEVVAALDPEGPEEGNPGDVPFNLEEVIWLHKDVSDWPVTAYLSSVEVTSSEVCLTYDKANTWPEIIIGDDATGVVANPWVFIEEAGQWYAATWEWMRPNQICKNKAAVAGDHIKKNPFGPDSGWKPESGQQLYFMMSGLARIPGIVNVSERSNIVEVVWP